MADEWVEQMTVGREGITPKQLQYILSSLPPACANSAGRPCQCQQLTGHCVSAFYWDAAQPGYSRVHTNMTELLPRAVAVLIDKRHTYSAVNTALTFYNWWVRMLHATHMHIFTLHLEYLHAAVALAHVQASGLFQL